MAQIILFFGLFLSVSVFGADLSFRDFLGGFELIGCEQDKDGVTVPATEICDTSKFKTIEVIELSRDTFQIHFLKADGISYNSPVMNIHVINYPDVVEQSGFINTPDGAVWFSERREKSSGIATSQKYVVFTFDEYGIPILNKSSQDLSPRLSQRFKLKPIN